MKWLSTPIDSMKLMNTAPMPISGPLRGMRLPKNTMRKKESAGSDGISQANLSTARSPLQQVDLVDVDGLPVPVDQDHDGQADPDFGGGDRDHEQGEHLSRELMEVG